MYFKNVKIMMVNIQFRINKSRQETPGPNIQVNKQKTKDVMIVSQSKIAKYVSQAISNQLNKMQMT